MDKAQKIKLFSLYGIMSSPILVLGPLIVYYSFKEVDQQWQK